LKERNYSKDSTYTSYSPISRKRSHNSISNSSSSSSISSTSNNLSNHSKFNKEDKEDSFDVSLEMADDLSNSSGVDLELDLDDESLNQSGELVVGGIPQTYRGMIKVALEHMSGQATFEAISKFIGTKFKDQLNNKAETWKHSIAGCLSVYFARKEQKDPSGKVIWTLGDPPKPKRRGRKRDRDESSPIPEREVSKNKRRKEEVVISVDHLESLEEENEYLKVLIAKKKKSEEKYEFSNVTCEICHERKELWMVLNPCGHLFCGSIFCEASNSKTCLLCNSQVSSRLPLRKGKARTKGRSAREKGSSNSNGYSLVSANSYHSNSSMSSITS